VTQGAAGKSVRHRRIALVPAALAGILIGVGLFTLSYAEGFSYLSTDPAACANCHIMRPQFESWQRASHAEAATCADCHLPHTGLEKWVAKADNGYRHSVAFTLQNFREPIEMTQGNRETLQRNCRVCHSELTSELGVARQEPPDCVKCHRGVGHGERLAVARELSPALRTKKDSSHD
jgi:cytochrome c nitrite reductase small subunit